MANKICVECSTENLEKAKFCITCGFRFDKSGSICPKCGATNQPNARFCLECGNRIDDQSIEQQNSHSEKYDVPLDSSETDIPNPDKNIGLKEAIRLGFNQYSKFDGRSTRAEYWWWYLFYGLVAMGLNILDWVLAFPLFAIIFHLAFFLPTLAVSVRRLHDVNRTGWWMTGFWLLNLLGILTFLLGIPFMLITALVLLPLGILLLYWYQKQGDLGPNKYGPDPRENSRESSYTGETEESTDDSQSDEIHCPICNVANQPNSKFCKQCGASLKNG